MYLSNESLDHNSLAIANHTLLDEMAISKS